MGIVLRRLDYFDNKLGMGRSVNLLDTQRYYISTDFLSANDMLLFLTALSIGIKNGKSIASNVSHMQQTIRLDLWLGDKSLGEFYSDAIKLLISIMESKDGKKTYVARYTSDTILLIIKLAIIIKDIYAEKNY